MPTLLKKEQGRNYIVSSFFAIFTIAIVKKLWPDTIPFGAFEFWTIRGTPMDWLGACWPFLAWCFVLNLWYISRAPTHLVRELADVGDFFKGAPRTFLFAALEELGFRWLLFLSAIVGVKVINFLFFGFLGFGITEWIFSIMRYPANWATLGYLEPQLFKASWAIGAALLSTNAFFRSGHAYQGIVGLINSWFLGMFMFWMTFKYGLVASIAFHFVNNMTAHFAGLCLGYLALAKRGR